MHGTTELMDVDLAGYQKKLILELAGFFVTDEITLDDLKNSRKKWIRFKPQVVSDVIGELSYRYNRCKSTNQSEILDELISHLEFTLSARKNTPV